MSLSVEENKKDNLTEFERNEKSEKQGVAILFGMIVGIIWWEIMKECVKNIIQ